MHKICTFSLLIFCIFSLSAQNPEKKTNQRKDSLKSNILLKQIAKGVLPTKYWNFDLRYLVKYNQFEALRTGIGGSTTTKLSKKIRLDTYTVYGFKDDRFKYRIGCGFRITPKTKTWINASYVDDLMETGSSNFLTDGRFFSFFEPRLLNIDLYYKHATTSISFEHEINYKLITKAEIASSNISTTYSYNYVLDNTLYKSFETTTAKISAQWSPFNILEKKEKFKEKIIKEGYPKFSLQYSKSFKGVLNGDFNFSKLDFRINHKVNHTDKSFTTGTLTTGIANGDIPLTHLYHAYPNNINKQTIMQRISVAGINSFETMNFNEFFSDKFSTLVVRHYLKPFKIYNRFKPQLVLVSRIAIGNLNNLERHQNISFKTLNHGYTESGFELNKLFFGFGLSCSYRYGAYHFAREEDNIAIKFTFNVTL